MGNGAKAQQKRERNAKDANKGGKSQLKAVTRFDLEFSSNEYYLSSLSTNLFTNYQKTSLGSTYQ